MTEPAEQKLNPWRIFLRWNTEQRQDLWFDVYKRVLSNVITAVILFLFAYAGGYIKLGRREVLGLGAMALYVASIFFGGKWAAKRLNAASPNTRYRAYQIMLVIMLLLMVLVVVDAFTGGRILSGT